MDFIFYFCIVQKKKTFLWESSQPYPWNEMVTLLLWHVQQPAGNPLKSTDNT